MRFEMEVDGRLCSLDLDERDGAVVANVDNRGYDVQVLRPEPGVYVFVLGSDVYEARVWQSEPGSFRVQVRDRSFLARIIDRKHRRPAADHGLHGTQQLVSAMPGKVVKVLVKQGDMVSAGQGVVVVEAMKMQNEIKSPKAGRVIELRVTAGATVNANQVLAVVE